MAEYAKNHQELRLTDRRLLARGAGSDDWRGWPLVPGLTLQHTDSGGLARLSLHDAGSRLAEWRFTLAANPDAVALLQQFERQLQRLADPTAEDDEAPADEETDFGADSPERPSTWVLLRLWRLR